MVSATVFNQFIRFECNRKECYVVMQFGKLLIAVGGTRRLSAMRCRTGRQCTGIGKAHKSQVSGSPTKEGPEALQKMPLEGVYHGNQLGLSASAVANGVDKIRWLSRGLGDVVALLA